MEGRYSGCIREAARSMKCENTFGLDRGTAEQGRRKMRMQEIVQVVMATFGAVTFSMIFNVRGSRIVVGGLGAGFAWAVYLFALDQYGDKVMGLLAATLAAGILSEIMARILKTPVTILLVPMLIPLVPGADLYYTTSFLLRGQMQECTERLNLFLREAGSIAFGIILVTCVVQVIQKICMVIAAERKKRAA